MRHFRAMLIRNMSSSSKHLRISSPERSVTDPDPDANISTYVDPVEPALFTSSYSSPCEDVFYICRSVFTDDILPLILDNLQILSPKDLIHFRLVNRVWRDAATWVLLKRNACEIALKIGLVAFNSDYTPSVCNVSPTANIYDTAQPVFKYLNARPPHSLLPDLIRLISTSPKFPSNSLKFLPGCEKALKNLSSSPAGEDPELEEDDLMRLFSLYGKKIKKLSFSTEISTTAVEHLLFVHLPNLTCLDLRNFEGFEAQYPYFRFPSPPSPSQGPEPELNSNSNHQTLKLKIENIYWGTGKILEPVLVSNKLKFVRSIINASPNLRTIKEASLALLATLIKIKKAHLVKCFSYNPPKSRQYTNLLAGFCDLEDSSFQQLKLSELTVKFTNIEGYPTEYESVIGILNMILKGSKDTLEYLELHVNPLDFLVNIQIPSLGKLKCLKLVQENETFGNPLKKARKCDQDRKREKRPRCKNDRHVFQFENEQNPNRIPLNYFPQLSKVFIDVGPSGGGSLNTYNKLLAFFALEHIGPDKKCVIEGDRIPTVTTLELSTFFPNDGKLGALFPNVRNLKIKCEPRTTLYYWVWETFPKLEQFELCDFIPGPGRDQQKVVDSFITGIPQEFCAKFADNDNHGKTGTAAAAGAGLEFSPAHINFLRTAPFIGSCRNLKEFTLHFKGKISSEFASKLTGLHTFQGIVNQTKIIFSFEAIKMTKWGWKDIQKYLEPVASYVEIR